MQILDVQSKCDEYTTHMMYFMGSCYLLTKHSSHLQTVQANTMVTYKFLKAIYVYHPQNNMKEIISYLSTHEVPALPEDIAEVQAINIGVTSISNLGMKGLYGHTRKVHEHPKVR